jgi:hypothetical protein
MMTETALGTVRTPLRAEHDSLHERWSVLDADGEMVTCFPYGLSRTPSQAEQLARMLVAGSQMEGLLAACVRFRCSACRPGDDGKFDDLYDDAREAFDKSLASMTKILEPEAEPTKQGG